MYGYLVPLSGGKTIPLTHERAYLGRRKDADRTAALNAQTALCQFRRIDGWWHVVDLASPSGLRVNGSECRTARVEPDGEVAIGLARFRLVYQSPLDDQAALEAVAEAVLLESPKPRPAAPATVERTETSSTASRQAAKPEGELLGRLVPLGGGMDYPLLKPRVTVGRKSTCDIVIRSKTVSSMHCGLESLDGYWRVLDLGSRNGIRVNGVRCQKAWLFPKSHLSIADHRFQIEFTPQGPPPEPDLSDPYYRMPLMQKIGASESAWEQALTRHEAKEREEPKRARYDPQEDL